MSLVDIGMQNAQRDTVMQENDDVPYIAHIGGNQVELKAGVIKHYLRAYGCTPWRYEPKPISDEERAIVRERLQSGMY